MVKKTATPEKEKALDTFKGWYAGLKSHSSSGGPAKGTISAGLVVLERLKSAFVLDLEAHRTPGGSQIRGASGQAVRKILSLFGETRPFLKEGGRTNRGGPGDIRKMLETIEAIGMESFEADIRNEILTELQRYLVSQVIEFHNRERLKLVYDPSKSTWQLIQDLLALARETGKEGPVAQHLVGAKLQLRFPDVPVSNENYSTADDQLGRPGDFHLGDTAFHVTVAPMPAVYEKCKANFQEGLRVYLLVPDRSLSGARQNAALLNDGKMAVESIESFVSQNIEEISLFSKKKLPDGLRKLIEEYNKRIDETEVDKSLLIEIPRNL
jgi:hypothetical protein